MARDINPFGLRMPHDLKRRIEKSAKTNRRSINAELILRLQDSIEKDPLFVPEIREESRSYELSEDENVLLKAYSTLSPRRRRALLELLTAFNTDK